MKTRYRLLAMIMCLAVISGAVACSSKDDDETERTRRTRSTQDSEEPLNEPDGSSVESAGEAIVTETELPPETTEPTETIADITQAPAVISGSYPEGTGVTVSAGRTVVHEYWDGPYYNPDTGEEISTYEVAVPEVTIDGVDTAALNDEIYNICSNGLTYTIKYPDYDDMGSDYYLLTDMTSEYSRYSYFVGEGYVSILLIGRYGQDNDELMFYPVNISAQSGAILTDAEFLDILGIEPETYFRFVNDTYIRFMENSSEAAFGTFGSRDQMDCREENLLSENINNTMPYVSDRGNLCFTGVLCTLWSLHGYEFACFDTDNASVSFGYDWREGFS